MHLVFVLIMSVCAYREPWVAITLNSIDNVGSQRANTSKKKKKGRKKEKELGTDDQTLEAPSV